MACSGSSGKSNSSSDGTGTSSTSGATSAASDSAATATDSGGGTTGVKIDLAPPDGECYLFEQDCVDPDMKCMPWSLEDDQIPDETRCCPMVTNPKQVGETCEIYDYNGSCLDDCDKGAVCILEFPDSLQGYCHMACDPNDEETCAPSETCKPFFEFFEDAPTVPLCVDKCDPLTQDCQRPGWTCVPDSPSAAGMSGFVCNPPPPQDPAGQGEPCTLSNACEIGLVCLPSENLTECSWLFCCTQFCDITDTDPCPAIDPALQCVDWMSADPQWQDVGACVLPE